MQSHLFLARIFFFLCFWPGLKKKKKKVPLSVLCEHEIISSALKSNELFSKEDEPSRPVNPTSQAP